MKIILQVSGGIGKSVAATAVCRAIKKQYPDSKLFVISGYPEVFSPSPIVDRSLSFNDLHYFYPEHIEGQDFLPLLHDPYHAPGFLRQEGHLIKVWCEMFGIAYDGEQPEIHLTSKEYSSFGTMFQSPKPIMIIQTNGGVPNQTDKYSWARDMPIATAQQVVNAFKDTYNIVHLRRQDQLPLQHVYPLTTNFRAIAVAIAMSSRRLFIDSFAQHAAAALGKPSVVCWVANKPEQFGYELHRNIIAHPPTLKPDYKNSIFTPFNIAGQPNEFCYNNESEIFDAAQIIAALNNMPA